MITIKEIALKLGMSTTTVSNVIHGKTKEVSPETIAKVEKMLRECEYVPNINARNLARNKSRIIGLAMKTKYGRYSNFIKDPFVSELLGAIEIEIRKKGYFMMLYISDEIEEILQQVSSWNADGLILLGMQGDDAVRMQEKYRNPIVCIDSYFLPEFDQFANVGLEDEQGTCEMIRYMIQCGHRKIAFIADNRIGVDLIRYEGYCKALREAEIPVSDRDFLQINQEEKQPGKSLERICRKAPQYSAFFCASDYYAVTIMNALINNGIRVPQDISVAGFDDNLLGRICRPMLTTVHQDVEKKGSLAVDILIREIGGEDLSKTRILLPTELVIRDSVKIMNILQ